MAGVRTLLARTRRLQAAKVHPVLAAVGGPPGWDAFQAEARAGVTEGRYDSRDVPIVVAALQCWLLAD